ncbi:MAG: hypothetical protein WCJ56_11475 [bacterium]
MTKKVPQPREQSRIKNPRSEPFTKAALFPVWSFQRLDIGGPWCFSKIDDANYFVEVLKKLGEFEKMNWNDLGSGGSHLIAISKLAKHAQKRLIEIKQEDIDELFSIRLKGKERVWGIMDNGVIRLLWWDPNHEICPSHKMHT